jgi:8-oxo-dGTP diphosphatase
VTRLFTRPYTRCAETLVPLGERLGLGVEPLDELGEGAGASGALALIDAAEAPVAICSHGDVIGDVIVALDRRGVPRDDDRLAKGSTWVLTRDGDAVVSAHYTPPPKGAGR